MNWDRLEGKWKQQRGQALLHWGKIMNDELSSVLGKYEKLAGKLQEKYGIAKAKENHRMREYNNIVHELRHTNSK